MVEIPEVGKTTFRKFDQSGVEYIGVVTWLKLYRGEDGAVKHWQALVSQPSGAEYVSSSDAFKSASLWHPIDYIHEVTRNRVAPPVVAEAEEPKVATSVETTVATTVKDPSGGRRKAA